MDLKEGSCSETVLALLAALAVKELALSCNSKDLAVLHISLLRQLKLNPFTAGQSLTMTGLLLRNVNSATIRATSTTSARISRNFANVDDNMETNRNSSCLRAQQVEHHIERRKKAEALYTSTYH